MTWTDSTTVWNLADASIRTRRPTRRIAPRAVVVAALGFVGVLGCSLIPLDLATRWLLVAAAGSSAAVLATVTLRRDRSVRSVLLVLAGLVLSVASGVVLIASTAAAAPPVVSAVVTDAAVSSNETGLRPSPRFASLPAEERVAATRTATALVMQIRSLHGLSGPYPTGLSLSNGNVVEATGSLRGTVIGSLGRTSRLRYEVTASRSAFQVVVVSAERPDASIAATSSLVVTEP
jgi:hypothetical protein